jgi:molybdopterin synthase sulfur carrier subunit
MQLHVRHFAEMKEQAGREQQTLHVDKLPDPRALYQQLQMQHGFRFEAESLRLAVNGRLVDWSTRLSDGDEISFLPPFSGG